MAQLIAAIPAALGGIGGLGTVLSVGGTILGGIAANKAAKAEAAQLEAQGKAEFAVAQRKSEAERRRKDLVISRARAVGAASGGGLDLNLIGDLEKEGEYNALVAEWEGKERQKGRNAQAAAARYEGKQGLFASFLKAGSTLLDNSPTLASKYG